MGISGLRITDLQGVFRMWQNEGSINHFYDRKGYGLIFVPFGVLRFDSGGKRYYCDNKHILFVPKGAEYVLTCEERCLHYSVNFDAIGEELPSSFLCFNASVGKSLTAKLDKLHTTWEFHWDSAKFSCLSQLYDILTWVNSVSGNSDCLKRNGVDSIHSSIEYLESHFTDPLITNELIAEASDVSTVYFRKLFTQAYGIPPMRYVRKKRIEKAQSLLESGYTTIAEVAESVGFNSIYHFSKTFKQIIGVSPTAYVKMLTPRTEERKG